MSHALLPITCTLLYTLYTSKHHYFISLDYRSKSIFLLGFKSCRLRFQVEAGTLQNSAETFWFFSAYSWSSRVACKSILQTVVPFSHSSCFWFCWLDPIWMSLALAKLIWLNRMRGRKRAKIRFSINHSRVIFDTSGLAVKQNYMWRISFIFSILSRVFMLHAAFSCHAPIWKKTLITWTPNFHSSNPSAAGDLGVPLGDNVYIMRFITIMDKWYNLWHPWTFLEP